MKKQLIESNYEKKQFELQLRNSQEEIQKLKNELKVKGSLILAIEKEKRKLESDLNRNLNRDTTPGRDRSRSISADRLLDQQRTRLSKQLLQNGQAAAYTVSKTADSPPDQETEEKLVLLQKLLLTKCRSMAEKEVRIEELSRQMQQLDSQVRRLKKTRYLAQELTECRHQLAQKINQLQVCLLQILSSDPRVTDSFKKHFLLNRLPGVRLSPSKQSWQEPERKSPNCVVD